MGDEYDYAEADYWSNADLYDADDQPQPRSFVNPGGLSKNEQRRREEERRNMPSRWKDPYGILMPEIQTTRSGIQFPTTDEAKDLVKKFDETFPRIKEIGQKMRQTDDLLAEAENLRLQAERLERIADQRQKYGDDPFKNGVVLKIDMRYRETSTARGRSYSYSVIKTAGRFWLSGRLIPQNGATAVSPNTGWTWEQFVAWLAQGDATVWRAKGLEQVL